MAAREYKRRRLLVDPLQLRLLGVTLLYFAATTTIFAVTLFTPLVLELRAEDGDVYQRAQVASEFMALHARFWPALFVTLALLPVHSIFTSHRIAGPLYRFRAIFSSVAAGNLMPWTSIRAGDLLTNEAAALSEMVLSLRSRIGDISRSEHETRRAFAGVKRAVQTQQLQDARAKLGELEGSLDELESRIEEFTYETPAESDGSA